MPQRVLYFLLYPRKRDLTNSNGTKPRNPNYKRTFLVGLAFLSICAFWQMYDNIVPLILQGTFHLNETLTGAIMAADNVLAVFLLPLLGSLSDKVDTRWGKRTPFIWSGRYSRLF